MSNRCRNCIFHPAMGMRCMQHATWHIQKQFQYRIYFAAVDFIRFMHSIRVVANVICYSHAIEIPYWKPGLSYIDNPREWTAAVYAMQSQLRCKRPGDLFSTLTYCSYISCYIYLCILKGYIHLSVRRGFKQTFSTK